MRNDEIHGIRHDRNIVERTEYRLRLRVEIAHEDQPVTLRSVIKKVLHIHADGIDRGVPDAVQPFIRGVERSRHFLIPIKRDAVDIDELYIPVQRIDPYKTEGGVAVFQHPHARQHQFGVVNGVILIRATHRFTDRFAEAQPDFPGGRSGDEAYRPMEFNPEIQKQAAAGQDFRHGIRRGDLRLKLTVSHQQSGIYRILRPDQTPREQIIPYPRIMVRGLIDSHRNLALCIFIFILHIIRQKNKKRIEKSDIKSYINDKNEKSERLP